MSQQSYEKWYPLERLPEYLSGVSLVTFRDTSLLIICRSGGDFEGDILLEFGYVHAYQVHEEFAHPWLDRSSHEAWPPRSSEDSKFAFPFLKVNDSNWLSTFSEIRLIALASERLHLHIITLGYFVDVLCDDYPEVKLVSEAAVERLFGAIEVFEIS